MSKILIPKTIFIFSRDHGKSKIEQNNLTIPKDILFFTIGDDTYLPIWKEIPKKDFMVNLGRGSYIELSSKIFIFNVLMLGVEFNFFIFDPEFDGENELINSNKRISSKKPHLLSKIISMGLDDMYEVQKKMIFDELSQKDNRTLFEINDQVTSTLFFTALKNKIINLMNETEDVEALTQVNDLADAFMTLSNGFGKFDNLIAVIEENVQENKNLIEANHNGSSDFDGDNYESFDDCGDGEF